MATYLELHELKNDSALLAKVETACIIAAGNIVEDGVPPANQAQRLKWAEQVFTSPPAMAKKVLPSVLAANSGASVATIQGASDAAFQNNVNSVIDLFADLIA